VEYEWDPRKARGNQEKHGVEFADAQTVLEDPLALTVPDPHEAEDRYVTVGVDASGNTLVVAWAFRGSNIRIISARKAEPGERREYESEG
jgi:hypothetical protein